MTSGLAAAHTDGQSVGAGESWRTAVRYHHRQDVLGPVLAGESTPACHDVGSVVWRLCQKGKVQCQANTKHTFSSLRVQKSDVEQEK